MCAKCKVKVAAEKRTCLYSLPDHLIVHLKRFEFDFDTMRKVKVNDKFEFPHSFSIIDYTREGLAKRDSEAKAGADGKTEEKPNTAATDNTKTLPSTPPATSTSTTASGNEEKDEQTLRRERQSSEWEALQRSQAGYYEYTLSGILVHTGMAEAGHYYSYIKDASSGDWLEFNDTAVRPFDIKDIPANCFGGSVWADVIDVKTGKTVRRGIVYSLSLTYTLFEYILPLLIMVDYIERQLINNAYMLIYDRVYKRRAVPSFDTNDGKQTSDSASNMNGHYDASSNPMNTSVSVSSPVATPVPSPIPSHRSLVPTSPSTSTRTVSNGVAAITSDVTANTINDTLATANDTSIPERKQVCL
jgi:hypothetical protein